MNNNDLNILHEFNILYLEDDENLLKHTKDILEDFVNNIYAVKTISEALDILLNKKVDVIISDILLKDENGIDFLKHIKNKNINIPTILTTAHTDTQYLLDAIRLKVENYIIKPINIKELLNSLISVGFEIEKLSIISVYEAVKRFSLSKLFRIYFIIATCFPSVIAEIVFIKLLFF